MTCQDDSADLLRRAGHKMTPQRLLIVLARRRVLVPLAVLGIVGIAGIVMANRAMQGSAQTADGCGAAGYPFQSIPCSLYQQGENRVALASPAAEASVPVSAVEAAATIAKLSPQSKILETRLVESWSAESTDPLRDQRLLWAVSSIPPGGILISGGAFFGQEMSRVRAKGDTRPLTADEGAAVASAVDADIAKARAAISESYHVDFIDPQTGAYIGAVEGAH